MSLKIKPIPLGLNASDIAGANVALSLVQIVIDKLIQEKIFKSSDIKEILDHIESFYTQPADPRRKQVRDAAVELARTIRQKYDVPPKAEQH